MKPLKFIHITKCAGTSIENIGEKHNILWGRYDVEYSNKEREGWHKCFPTIHPDIIEKYDWFMVVRNPYTRLASEFAWEQKVGWTWADNPLQANERLIQKIKKRSTYGNHYTEQSAYLHPTKQIHILKFENLAPEFEELMKRYNMPDIHLDIHENTSQKQFGIHHFSKELIVLINEVYHMDFVNFQYEKIDLSQTRKINPTSKCKREGCKFRKCPIFENNGGSHCCIHCKLNEGHSPFCTSVLSFEQCRKLGCTYYKHPDIDNNGGNYCCKYCKESREGHSSSCTSFF